VAQYCVGGAIETSRVRFTLWNDVGQVIHTRGCECVIKQ